MKMKISAVGAAGNRVLRGFPQRPVGALFASMGSVGVHGPGAGGRHGVRVAYERTQTWGEGPVLPTGTLVTVSGSDRPSRSLLLCHGSGSLSSRRPPRALRRRGPAPPTESLSSLQPSLRRLRGVRPRPCLLHTIVVGRQLVAGRFEPPGPAINAVLEGRLDHRDRQRAYRTRRRVTDHTSPASRPSDRLPVPDAAPGSRTRAVRGLRPVEPVADSDAGASRRAGKEGR